MVETYSLKKDGNTKLSANFAVKEFRCKDGSDAILIDTELVNMLQNVRNWANAPVTINSAYRTPTHNAKVGGATNSNHTKGKACDIVVKGKEPVEVARHLEEIGAKGIIVYSTFVHVDTRDSKYYSYNNNGTVVVTNTFIDKKSDTDKSLDLIEMITEELERSNSTEISASFETKDGLIITVKVERKGE